MRQGAEAAAPALRVWLPVALALGIAQAISIAEPWHGQPLWWLQLASLAGFVWLLDAGAASWRTGALIGWVFCTAWLSGTYWWMYISMHTYGGMPAPIAAIAVFLLGALLALYYAVVCGFFKRFWPKALVHWSWRAIIFAALWLLAELARGVWFTGLPWGAGGYAQIDGPLAALAPLAGVYAMTFACALLAALVALSGGARGLRVALAALVLLACALAPAHTWSSSTGTFQVSLLQGNIPQNEKFGNRTGVPLALSWYAEQLLAAPGDLVVAPETAVPLLPRYLPPGYLPAIEAHFESAGQAALIGIPLTSNSGAGYTNSVLGFAPGRSRPYRYDKHHLVPFGEFVPPLFKWFVRMMEIPLGDFDRGDVGQPSFAWHGQRLAPNICYEDLFSEELGARFADPATAPTIFVNVSNIAWFGDSVAIDQHLAMSRLRAIEFERPVIRATNTGATAIIDHRGRVLKELPRYTRGVLTGSVEGRSGNTPYADWVSRWWLWPFWAIAGGVPLLGWFAQRRQR